MLVPTHCFVRVKKNIAQKLLDSILKYGMYTIRSLVATETNHDKNNSKRYLFDEKKGKGVREQQGFHCAEGCKGRHTTRYDVLAWLAGNGAFLRIPGMASDANH
ncbi:hypothetical protein TNIN_108491 [Trichonephila inaurata madagascariensis]|uniref:Uncharacterized protein n=1 Tax=Trichonephila inaurata madagascariensis TaxID=2747483 RepID=A0A8X6YCD6_9ARAC|nr:hypothetical protein TNIN_108491 [Trichonephila inaurata madagascariensis]